jgi:hypothetical protein
MADESTVGTELPPKVSAPHTPVANTPKLYADVMWRSSMQTYGGRVPRPVAVICHV